MKNIALIGSGHIARDLYRKINNENSLNLFLVAGRNINSEGMQEAKNFSKNISSKGIIDVVQNSKNIDIVIDCTSAASHRMHAPILEEHNIPVVDLTPSGIGEVIIPTVNLQECKKMKNINLVSCGGQSSIPILAQWYFALKNNGISLDYVEVASTISSKSAGMATRLNIDNYVETTEKAITKFCKCDAKVILNINPALPPITMKTSLSALINDKRGLDIDWIKTTKNAEKQIKDYVPGYEINTLPQMINPTRLFTSVVVSGKGDYLPKYSGNLDIITSAAIEVSKYL